MTADTWPRWQNSHGISDLSVAIDEIYFLRALLADEADILEAHLGYKTFPKTRRKYAEAQIERMKAAARGDLITSRRPDFHSPMALRRAGAEETLTNAAWAAQRGLTRVDPETA